MPEPSRRIGAPEIIGGYPVHPIAQLFPLLEGEAYQDLKKSIEQHGQQEPIVVHKGVLIDGRNRLKALLELSRQPVFQEYSGRLAVEDFILIENLFRRHLTDDQRAMITARAIYPKEAEAAREREKSGKKQPRDPGAKSPRGGRAPKVTEKIASVAKVTDYQGRQTANVLNKAPGLVEPVANGAMRLKDADKEARRRKVAKAAMPKNPPPKPKPAAPPEQPDIDKQIQDDATEILKHYMACPKARQEEFKAKVYKKLEELWGPLEEDEDDRPQDRRSPPKRWQDGVEELREPQTGYERLVRQPARESADVGDR